MSKVFRVCMLLEAEYGRPAPSVRVPVIDGLIRTVLSQNTTAKNCHEAFRRLTERFLTWEDVRNADVEDIAEAIRVGGLANRKAPRIKQILVDVHKRQGNLDLEWIEHAPQHEAIDYMLGFEGVGRKTAACVMMFGLGRPVMPVDTHVHRVATRLGLIGKMSADAAHDALLDTVPPQMVYLLHVNLVTHGRRVCHARNPACGGCVLKKECECGAPSPVG